MATTSNPIYAGFEQGRARRDQLTDEQRQAQLANLANSGLSPVEVQKGIALLYQNDPSKLKEHVENLAGRLVGRKPVPVGQQAQNRQQQLAALTAKGKPLPQQQQELLAQQQNSQLEGKQKLYQWYQSLPPEQRKVAGPILGIKETAPYKTYVSPDGKQRQEFRVGEQPSDWQIAPTGSAAIPAAKPLEAGGIPYGVQTASGTYFANQMNDPSTPPEVRQTWSTIQAGLKAKQDEQDKRQHEADERQMRSLAAIAGRMGQSERFQEQMAGYRADLTTYRTLDKQARDDDALVNMYSQQLNQPGNKSAFDTALVTDYTGILAKGGRKTQAEIQFAQQIGGLGLRAARMWTQAQSGELPPQMRQLYIDYLKARAVSDRAEADAAKPEPPVIGAQGKGPAPKKQQPKGSATDPLGCCNARSVHALGVRPAHQGQISAVRQTTG
jgi:hypothetical protein